MPLDNPYFVLPFWSKKLIGALVCLYWFYCVRFSFWSMSSVLVGISPWEHKWMAIVLFPLVVCLLRTIYRGQWQIWRVTVVSFVLSFLLSCLFDLHLFFVQVDLTAGSSLWISRSCYHDKGKRAERSKVKKGSTRTDNELHSSVVSLLRPFSHVFLYWEHQRSLGGIFFLVPFCSRSSPSTES